MNYEAFLREPIDNIGVSINKHIQALDYQYFSLILLIIDLQQIFNDSKLQINKLNNKTD